MLGALAEGETIISGLLTGEDVLNTAFAMRAMGVRIYDSDDGLWHIEGAGTDGLQEPVTVLDMGNSGTSTRLLMGIAAGYDMAVCFTGDASLVRRPMERVIAPLTQMGAQCLGRSKGRLPLMVKGSAALQGMTYHLPVASAQVKSAVLLAGLRAQGMTTVIEDKPTRDHTENMLRHFGIDVETGNDDKGNHIITVTGGGTLTGCAVDVPADPSSAAFPAVAALLHETAELCLPRVGVNERRTGLYETLRDMGADIVFANTQIQAGEPVADIMVKGGAPLKGIDVPPERVPRMIDEFPVLAVAASCAEGTTRMTGLSELRVKESDRLALMAKGLAACGVKLEEGRDSLTIHGTGKPPAGGALVETALDHRIAMSFLVLGSVTGQAVAIDDARPIATSFPGFTGLMNGLGLDLRDPDEDRAEDDDDAGLQLLSLE